MKKLVLIVLACTLISCGSSKVVRQAQSTVKGTWSLSSITYDRAGTYNITLLNDVSKDCFTTSKWQFIPNDYKGHYSIINGNCDTGDRYFKYDIQEVDETTGLYDFLLKPTDEKYNSETNQGFRLKLVELSETSMQWEQTVNLEGNPFTINMNFTKLD